MLKIENLHVSIKGKEILKGVNLDINKGEVHAIMGPNGTGKSTLASVIAGKELFEVTEGSITYNGKNLLEMPIEDRAREGIFIGFQYPVEIPGVSITNFMKTALEEIRRYRGLPPLTELEFRTQKCQQREHHKVLGGLGLELLVVLVPLSSEHQRLVGVAERLRDHGHNHGNLDARPVNAELHFTLLPRHNETKADLVGHLIQDTDQAQQQQRKSIPNHLFKQLYVKAVANPLQLRDETKVDGSRANQVNPEDVPYLIGRVVPRHQCGMALGSPL